MNRWLFPAMALALILAGSVDADAMEGKFRGMYVCAKLPTTRDILRTPVDLIVHDNSVQLARPLFNLTGDRVVGTELAAGTIDGDGTLHLVSKWSFLGNTAEASYTGKLTSEGGTLVGSQNWKGTDGGDPVSRPCAVALVPAPGSSDAALANDGASESTEDEP